MNMEQELFQMLMQRLPEEFAEIKQFYQKNDTENLLKSVHKLHGAVCYCGVPPLRQALLSLEVALKNKKDIKELFINLEKEVNIVLQKAA